MDCDKLASLITEQIIRKYGKGFAPLYETLNAMGKVSVSDDSVFTTRSGDTGFCQLFREVSLMARQIESERAETILKTNLKKVMRNIDHAFLYSMRGVAYDRGFPRRNMFGIAQWLLGNSRFFDLKRTTVAKQFDKFGPLDRKLVLCGKGALKLLHLEKVPVDNFIFDEACQDHDCFVLDLSNLSYCYSFVKEMEGFTHGGMKDIRIYRVDYYRYPEYEILAELSIDFESPESHSWIRIS